jgi:radical SAM superfamily enzyme YgiQ (UPF0313 family)
VARIAFIQYLWLEQLGVAYLSAGLKRHGHDVLLAICGPRDFARRVCAFQPNLLAFQCTTGMQSRVAATIRRLREALGRRVLSIVGGPHPTFFPELVEDPEIDIVCLGEGEFSMLELVRALDRGERWDGIKGLWTKRDGTVVKTERRPPISDLDQLPFPDRHIYDHIPFIRDAPTRPFITARGCPYRCTFCFNHALRKITPPGAPFVRRRSVSNVLEELKAMKREKTPRALMVRDDHFCLPPHDWTVEFLNRYREEIAVPYFILARADSLTPSIVDLLKISGCAGVELAVETGDEALRNRLLRKELSDSQLLEAARLLHERRLPFVTMNMTGLPGETVDQALRTVTFNIQLRPTTAWCSVYQPMPATELGQYCFEHGLVKEAASRPFDVHAHSGSLLRQRNIARLVNMHKFVPVTVRLPWLLPIVRVLIRLPPNALYRWFFLLSYLILYRRLVLFRPGLLRLAKEMWVAFRYYY